VDQHARPPRLDAYGTPVPGPQDVRRQYLGDSAGNQERTRALYALVEQKLRDVLRRGYYGSVTIVLCVQDGTLDATSAVQTTEELRGDRR
jgi:hypothetical protein